MVRANPNLGMLGLNGTVRVGGLVGIVKNGSFVMYSITKSPHKDRVRVHGEDPVSRFCCSLQLH